MKLVFFDDFKLGVVKDGNVVDVGEAVRGIHHTSPHDLITRLIEEFEQHRPALEEAANRSAGVPLERVRLRAPLPRPGKIVCMAVNYMEDGTRSEPAPINAFLKSPAAVVGDGDTIDLPSAEVTTFNHEAELGLVIGRRASRVRAEEALDYIFGYVNFIDVSARGLGTPQMDNFFLGKSWHDFAPMGPYLVTSDEVPDPQSLPVKLWMNGVLFQDYNTSNMAHKIRRCMEWTSWITTLLPGDVLATGTNHRGLGPLQDRDEMVMEIQGLGRLTNYLTDELKREWPRETRAQAAAREVATRGGSS